MAVRTFGGRKFDREVKFDDRSREYRISDHPEVVRLRELGLRQSVTHYDEWWGDQGDTGRCVGWGWEGFCATRPLGNENFDDAAHALEADHFYERAQYFDGVEHDDQTGASTLGGVKAVQEAGYVTTYRWGFSLDDLLDAVVVQPVVIGINWYEGMMEPDVNGFVYPTGDAVGGHEIVVRGIAVGRKHVRLRNSWGPRWGPIQGDCRIKWADMDRLLHEDGDCCLATKVAYNEMVR